MDDAERITKALRRRGVSMRCPACEFVLRGPVGGYRLMPDVDGQEETLGGSGGIKVMVYACGNCGYVRLHSANVLGDAAS